MPVAQCSAGCGRKAILKRPKTGQALCKDCFFWTFETEIHFTIVRAGLFKKGEYVAIGASGGKDSTVLAYIMKTLNDRYNYGLKLVLLSIDEGITGYRDDSLETVKRNRDQYGIPLKILSYEDLYGWTMDKIVAQVGLKNNCTFCGVFRRQALDRGAAQLNVDRIVTGHNADDIAETVVMNILRGDVARLQRCTAITTGTEGAIPRCKPFKYTYEKEIVMYAYFKKLDYFSTECIYSPNAYRGHARAYIKDVEKIRPSAIMDIIHSGEQLNIQEKVRDRMPTQGTCGQCGYITSQETCKACVMLAGLNKGLPQLGVGKSSKHKKAIKQFLGEPGQPSGETAGSSLCGSSQTCNGVDMSAPDVTQVSSMPTPPMQYVKQYSDESVKRGLAPRPPPPMQDSYTAFGVTINNDDAIIQTLESQGIKRLYSAKDIDRKKELRKLNHSILVNFLDLIDILIKSPESVKREEKIEDINLLFIHMHHLINEFRPHQARETLRVMLMVQKRKRIQFTEKFREQLEKVHSIIQEAIENLPDKPMDTSGDGGDMDSDQDGAADKKADGDQQGVCSTQDKLMCQIVDELVFSAGE